MSYTREPESQASRMILRRANWQREPMHPRNLDAPGSSKSQKSEGKPGATSLALVHRADFRSQGVLQTETDQQKGVRQKLMSNLLRAFPSDPGKKNMRQELQESGDSEKTPFSEDKQRRKFSHKENTDCFDFCAHGRKTQCVRCFCYSTPGHFYCRCGTIFTKELAGSEAAKKSLDLNQQWFDCLTIPLKNVIGQLGRIGPCSGTHCHRDWPSYKVVLKSNHMSTHDRFMKDPVYRASHLKINWTDETCLKIG